jgi:amino acid transporter
MLPAMISEFKRFVIGRPLKSEGLNEEKLSKLKALAVLSSDALSSVAYGTEQILIVLMAVGLAALWVSVPISLAVLALLTILILSYRQTIFAYPSGGGAYIVAKENLGVRFGLLAGGSLLVDYILTVAVSVSAGTDAITSAFPQLHDSRVLIAVVMVAFLTIMNLRGLTESATVLSYPVYMFVIMIAVLIVAGLVKVASGGAVAAVVTSQDVALSGVSLFLLLRAFSSGCSALTGVEAVSNAIPNFRTPAASNAAKTLLLMGVILGSLFFGITVLAYLYHIVPNPEETVVSQIAGAVFGRGIVYYIVQASTALILFLAANTAYAAFPLLASMMAKDKFMPHMFSVRGDRLGFSNGILVLGVLSAFLIIAFEGHTEGLIPMYALGVFIPFTLSQSGMMRRWLRLKPKGWGVSFAVNTVGALTTLFICLIFIVTKFSQVWMIFLFLPVVIYGFIRIRHHYDDIANELRIDLAEDRPVEKGNVIVVPIAGVNRVVLHTIGYAKSISDTVLAVYVAFDDEEAEKMEKKWAEWNVGVRLVTLRSHYRSILRPLAKFIDTVEWKTAETDYLTIMIPQFVTRSWWHNLLHNQSSLLIKTYLLSRKDVSICTVPYHLKQ